MLFGTDGIRGMFGSNPVTETFALRLGRAFGTFLHGGTAAIGMDTRTSSPPLLAAAATGLQQAGCTVQCLGIVPTPCLSFFARKNRLAGGLMITASHNPPEYNGFKLFRTHGEKLSVEEEARIEHLLTTSAVEGQGSIQNTAAAPAYLEALRRDAARLDGVRIVVDSGNGATAHLAPQFFRALGAQVIALNSDGDGSKINVAGGAMHPANMAQRVRKEHAAAGFAFDGDGDRMVCCDANGSIVSGEQVMAMLALRLHDEGALSGGAIVASAYSNTALDALLSEHGIAVFRVPAGDRNVWRALSSRGHAFGGEPSGHFIFATRAATGDGMLAAVQLLRLMQSTGKPLASLSTLVLHPQMIINVRISRKVPLDALRLGAAVASAEHQLAGKGRVLVRYSGTEPVLRIMVEGQNEKEIKRIAAQLATIAEMELT